MPTTPNRLRIFLMICWLCFISGSYGNTLITQKYDQQQPTSLAIVLTQNQIQVNDDRGLHAVVKGLDPETLHDHHWVMQVINEGGQILYFQWLDPSFDSFFVFNPGQVGHYRVVLRNAGPSIQANALAETVFEVMDGILMHSNSTALHPDDPWGITVDISGLDPFSTWHLELQTTQRERTSRPVMQTQAAVPDARGVASLWVQTPPRPGSYLLVLSQGAPNSSGGEMVSQLPLQIDDSLSVRAAPNPLNIYDTEGLEARAFGVNPGTEVWMTLRPSYESDLDQWPSAWVTPPGESFDLLTPLTGGAYSLEAYDAPPVAHDTEPLAGQEVLILGDNPVPNAPFNLVATVVSSRQVHLDWDHDGQFNPDFWHCRRGTSWSCDLVFEPGTEWLVNNLQPDTDYRFKVYASNIHGNSDDSNEVSIRTPPPGPPHTPTGVDIHLFDHQPELFVRWDANDPLGEEVDGYRVYFSINGGGFSLFEEVSPWETNVSHLDLAANTTYRYRVTAFNSIGESAPSNTVRVTTDPPPPTPNNLSVVEATGFQVRLTWSVPSYCCDRFYQVQRRDADDSSSSWATIGTSGGTQYTDNNVEPIRRYRYRVRSCRYDNAPSWCGGFSSAVTAFTSDHLPGRPVVEATVEDWNRIRLSLTAAAPGGGIGQTDSFEIRRADQFPSTYNLIGHTSQNVFVDDQLEEQTRYYYRVTAINSTGPSVSADTSLLVTPAAPSPSVPINVTTTPINGTRIRVDFEPGPVNTNHAPAERFVASVGQNGSVIRFSLSFPADLNSYTFIDLDPLTTYEFAVSARRNSGTSSDFSNPVPGTTLSLRIPDRPQDLEAVAQGQTSTRVTWRQGEVSGIHDPPTQYTLQRALGNGSFNTVATIEEDQSSEFIDSDLEPNTFYRYRVRAENDAGTSPFAGPVTVRTEAPPPEPDLAITSITATYDDQPRTYYFTAIMTQLGTGPVPQQGLAVRLYLSLDEVLDDADIAYEPVRIPLEFEQEAPYGFRIPFPPQATGPVYMIAEADANNIVEETNENNNTLTLAFNAPGTLGPDLVIQSDLPRPELNAPGGTIAIPEFRLVNQGNGTAGGSTLALGLRPEVMPEQLVIFSTETTGALAAGEQRLFPTQSANVVVPPGRYRLVAIADFVTGSQMVDESDENNNERWLATVNIQ